MNKIIHNSVSMTLPKCKNYSETLCWSEKDVKFDITHTTALKYFFFFFFCYLMLRTQLWKGIIISCE